MNEKKRLSTKAWNALTLIGGSVIITAWTLLKFFTQPVKYDLIGQQLLARQWLEGDFGGSVSAPTNYIGKMLLLYMPADILGLDPKLFLLLSTIIVNIMTFIGLYFILRAILRYFHITVGSIFNLSMLWLATIAGSVFWIQFTNSRNLELVVGLVMLYLGLLIYRNPTIKKCIAFALVATAAFFADPMQLFITAVILIVYVVLRTMLKERSRWKRVGVITGLIGVSYLASALCVHVVQAVTHVSFFSVGSLSQSVAIMGHLPTVMTETAKNLLRLFGGSNEMGVWRQVLNLVGAGFFAVFSIVMLIKNNIHKEVKAFTLFIAIGVAVTIAVYIASGQPLAQSDTSRYLIILAPLLVLLFSSLDAAYISSAVRCSVLVMVGLVVSINAAALLMTAFANPSTTFVGEAHLRSRYDYVRKGDYSHGYASMDTALPATYVFGQGSSKVLLPLSCGPEGLGKATLFFDRDVFLKKEIATGEVPVILDGQSINNYPFVCSIESIKKQLGEPIRSVVYNGDTILIYKAQTVSAVHFSAAVSQ